MDKRGKGVETKTRGFSLVELLVTLVIGLLLIGGVGVVFLSSQQAVNEAQSLSRMQENLRFAADYLVRDVRNAGFRDEGALTIAQFRALGDNPPAGSTTPYVSLENDGRRVTVRYAGRGDCNDQFADLGIVQNTYEVLRGNELTCNGVLLVSGVTALSASSICRGGSNNCCPGPDCMGLDLTLELESRGGFPAREVVLKAIMRNRVLAEMFD